MLNFPNQCGVIVFRWGRNQKTKKIKKIIISIEWGVAGGLRLGRVKIREVLDLGVF